MVGNIDVQMGSSLGFFVCAECGALLLTDPEVVRMTGDPKILHGEWHEAIKSRINEAAKVGQHGDLMTRTF